MTCGADRGLILRVIPPILKLTNMSTTNSPKAPIYIRLRRPLLGGLLSALVTGTLLWTQFYGMLRTPNRVPSMRQQAFRLAAAVPIVLIGGNDLTRPVQLALSVSFWFLEGALIAGLIRKTWLAIGLWGLIYGVAYVVSYILFFTFFP